MSADAQQATPDSMHLPSRATATTVAFGGMLALAAGMGIGRFVYTPILPDMAAALGLSKSAAGLIASANFLGYLAGALLAALPHLPGGRRAWFLGGLAASAATTAAMALPDSMLPFLLLRFVGGVASAFVLVLGSALVLDRLAMLHRPGRAALHFAGVGVGIAVSSVLVDVLHAMAPQHRRRSFALITAGFGLGQIAGPSVAGLLLDRTNSFAAPSLIAAAAVAVAAVIAMRMARAGATR
jgi:MFS family permease